jgi:hypothetical protein
VGAVGNAGGVLVTETVRATGLDVALAEALAPWRGPNVTHDPAKVVTDLALALMLGGDCLADVGLLRAEPGVYGSVASDPTVSRTIAALAADAEAALAAIDGARARARATAWRLAGRHAPDHDVDARRPLVIDVDATLVTAHSDKERAAPTFKKGFGFHPLVAFVDHGPAGTGEPLSVLLRAGNAGSNTAADHITVIRAALAQLPGRGRRSRASRKILVRTDGAGSTHKLLDWLTTQRLSYSVGFTLPEHTPDLLSLIPQEVWTPAYDAHDQVRDGAWVAELTGLLDLTSWPKGMRVIVRKERPHPGAQLRFDDVDGMRITAFATNTRPGGPHAQLADLELRHRRRARGPHPHRQGHRPDQPAPALLRRQPHLVRHRRPRARAHRLDADPRPDRPPGPPVGTQAPAPAAAHRASGPGPPGAPAGTAPREPRTLGHHRGRRAPPAAQPRPRTRLTGPAPRIDDHQHDPEPGNPPTRTTPGRTSYPPARITPRNRR